MDISTKLCVHIPIKDEDHELWWRSAISAVVLNRYGAAFAPDEVADDAVGRDWLTKYPYIEENYKGESICDIFFRDDDRFPGGLLIIEDACGDAIPDGVGAIIKAFLETFDIAEPVAFAFADTGSTRPDVLGGGVVFVERGVDVVVKSTFVLIEDWVTERKVPYTLNLYDSTPYGIGDDAMGSTDKYKLVEEG